MTALWRTLRILLIAGQACVLLVSFYQSSVTVLGHLAGWRRGPRLTDTQPRFALIVCARNEQRVIGRLLNDLRSQTYPADLFEVVVSAHNCTDGTAAVARRMGFRVVEARTPGHGKSLAIAAGLKVVSDAAEFVGVFDADSRVAADFLESVARRSEGASAIQVESVPQRTLTWIGEGHGIARRARNIFWWRPREALGLGTTINGSGFFLRASLARELIPELRSITEDLELTAHLYASGYRVRFVSTAHIRMEETAWLKPMMRQRSRWVRGHLGVIRNDLPQMLHRGLRGDVAALDIALYMLAPTRVITRTAISAGAVWRLARLPGGLPAALVLTGLISEWVVPAAVAFQARLVPRSAAGLKIAVRQSMIGMLWFPVGLWALLTPGRRTWHPTPRTNTEEAADAVSSR